ncbi:MAG: hypothetical protein ABL901_04145 [Hyphomicrobiaceae bacterium]
MSLLIRFTRGAVASLLAGVFACGLASSVQAAPPLDATPVAAPKATVPAKPDEKAAAAEKAAAEAKAAEAKAAAAKAAANAAEPQAPAAKAAVAQTADENTGPVAVPAIISTRAEYDDMMQACADKAASDEQAAATAAELAPHTKKEAALKAEAEIVATEQACLAKANDSTAKKVCTDASVSARALAATTATKAALTEKAAIEKAAKARVAAKKACTEKVLAAYKTGTATRGVVRIKAATFGDVGRGQTCDGTIFFIRACHMDAAPADSALASSPVLKDAKDRPTYCFVKRSEAKYAERYKGIDLCGFNPTPVGTPSLIIEYACDQVLVNPPSGSAVTQARPGPMHKASFPGGIEWVRLACAQTPADLAKDLRDEDAARR